MANRVAWLQAPDGPELLAGEAVRRSLRDATRLCALAVGPPLLLASAVQLAGLVPPRECRHAPEVMSPSSPGCRAPHEPPLAAAGLAGAGAAAATAAALARAPLRARVCAALLVVACVRPPGGGGLRSSAAATLRTSQQQQEALLCGRMASQLLAQAAEVMQQHPQQHPQQQPQPQLQGFLLRAFCDVVRGWALPVLASCTSPEPDGACVLSALLRLVLGALAEGEECALLGAHAARALVTAARGLGWGPLHRLTPGLLAALQQLECAAAEADVVGAISASLTLQPGGEQQDVMAARVEATLLLLGPLHTLLSNVLAQLRAGCPWASMSTWADAQLAHHLARLRLLLDTMALTGGGAANAPAVAPGAAPVAADGASASAAFVAHAPVGFVPRRIAAASGISGGSSWGLGAGEAAQLQQQEPLLQLVVRDVWPLVHAICMAGAGGRFLPMHAKCCSAVLRTNPCVMLAALEPFLEVCSAAYVVPGGISLGEPLAIAIEAFCGPDACAPPGTCNAIVQALTHIWSRPEVTCLRQPGAGDARPELAEHTLRLAATFIRHGLLPQAHGAAVALVDAAVLAAGECAGCCHRKVASAALGLLAALLAAAAVGGVQQAMLLQLVEARGESIVRGAVGALLAPSPLPRVQKVTNLLLDLADMLQLWQQQQQRKQQRRPVSQQPAAQGFGDGAGRAPPGGHHHSQQRLAHPHGRAHHPGSHAAGHKPRRRHARTTAAAAAAAADADADMGELGSDGGGGGSGGGADVAMGGDDDSELLLLHPAPNQLCLWLAAAAEQLPAGAGAALAPGEARSLLAEWAALLTQPPRSRRSSGGGGATGAGRSYVLSRRLKTLVREFAERCSRPVA